MEIESVMQCTQCKKKIKSESMRTMDLNLYAEETWPRDFAIHFALRELRESSPYIRRIKWKYHSVIHDFSRGHLRDCGPLKRVMDFEKAVHTQMD